MNKTLYHCSTCDKKYLRKSSLEKHTVLCAFLIKNEREKQIQNEEDKDIPSYIQLVGIVQQLSLKYSLLETEMMDMQKWVEKKKKKINVVSWLNTNIEPSTTFDNWTNNLSITEEHFTFLMENSITDTFQIILEENLTNSNNNNNTIDIHPIKCFSQKNNVFYVYKPIKNELKNSCEWSQMTFEDTICLLKRVQGKLLKAVMKWKTENKEYIDANDNMSILYNKTIIKLMDITFSKDTTFGKIRANLYTYLKTDLKNLFEYEFEF
jgi:hypothetical protein